MNAKYNRLFESSDVVHDEVVVGAPLRSGAQRPLRGFGVTANGPTLVGVAALRGWRDFVPGATRLQICKKR